MSVLEGFPLPATARHDEQGRHITPHIPEWRKAADPTLCAYDPNRVVRGREVERDQRQKALFHAHLEEHRRRSEPAEVVEWFAEEEEPQARLDLEHFLATKRREKE